METHVGLFYVYQCSDWGCWQSLSKSGNRIYDSVIRNYTFTYLLKVKLLILYNNYNILIL